MPGIQWYCDTVFCRWPQCTVTARIRWPAPAPRWPPRPAGAADRVLPALTTPPTMSCAALPLPPLLPDYLHYHWRQTQPHSHHSCWLFWTGLLTSDISSDHWPLTTIVIGLSIVVSVVMLTETGLNGKRDQTPMGWKFARKHQRRTHSRPLQEVTADYCRSRLPMAQTRTLSARSMSSQHYINQTDDRLQSPGAHNHCSYQYHFVRRSGPALHCSVPDHC